MAKRNTAPSAWRSSLRVASFRGVYFHVEVGGRMSGRRTVTHEYPKRNLPYAEDMGRHAVRWQITGYILLEDHKLQAEANRRPPNLNPNAPYDNLLDQRNKLIEALERDGAGTLYHPSLYSYKGGADGSSPSGPMSVMCERYSISESRERGGYYEIEMQFVESGAAPVPIRVDPKGNVISSAAAVETAASQMMDQAVLTSFGGAAGIVGMAGSPSGPALVR